MRALTPAERRGALLVALLLALGAVRDLVMARYGPEAPPPAAARLDPAAGADPGGAAAAPGAPPAHEPRSEAGAPLDINRAGPEELDRLPGIGPVLARRIVEHRARYGPFAATDELLAVRGVGPALFERLRGRVSAGAALRRRGGPGAPPRGPRSGVHSARRGARGAADSAQVDSAPDR